MLSGAALPARGGLARKLAHGSVRAFAVYGVGAGMTYCSQLLIARLVGAQSYGVYAYVFSWATVLAYMAALGFDVSLLRLVPAYRANGKLGLARGVVRYAERCGAVVGLLVVAGGSLVVVAAGTQLSPEMTATFLVGLPLVPVWAVLWVRSSAVRAYGGVISALAPDRVVRDGSLVLLLGIAWLWWTTSIGPAFVMALTLAGSLIGLAVVSLALRRRQPGAIGSAAPEYAASLWWSAALPLVLISLGETVMNRTGVVLLGWVGHTQEAGIYALSFTIAAAVLLPRTALNALFAPLVSELFALQDQAALQFIVTKTARWTLLSAVCIALPIGLFATPLMSLFGADFAQGAAALRVLLLGQVIAAGAGPQMYLLTMTGNERIGAALLVGSVVANAVGSAFLIGGFGLFGAAAATTATLLALNAAMAMVVWRRLGLVPAGLGSALTRRPTLRLRHAGE